MSKQSEVAGALRKFNQWVVREEHRPLKIINNAVKTLGNNYRKKSLSEGAMRYSELRGRYSTEKLTTLNNIYYFNNSSDDLDIQNEFVHTSTCTDLQKVPNCEKISCESTVSPDEQFAEVVTLNEGKDSFRIENEESFHIQSEKDCAKTFVRSRIDYFEASSSLDRSSDTNNSFNKRGRAHGKYDSTLKMTQSYVQQRINQFEKGSCLICFPNMYGRYESIKEKDEKVDSKSDVVNNRFNDFDESEKADADSSLTSMKNKILELENSTDESLVQHIIKQLHSLNERGISKNYDLYDCDFSSVRDKIKLFSKCNENNDLSAGKQVKYSSNLEEDFLSREIDNGDRFNSPLVTFNTDCIAQEEAIEDQVGQNIKAKSRTQLLQKLADTLDVSFEENNLRYKQNNDQIERAFNSERYSNFLSDVCKVLDISLEREPGTSSSSNKSSMTNSPLEFEGVCYQPSSHGCQCENAELNPYQSESSTLTSTEYLSVGGLYSCFSVDKKQEEETFVKYEVVDDYELCTTAAIDENANEESQYFDANTSEILSSTMIANASPQRSPMKKQNKDVESKFVVNVFKNKISESCRIQAVHLKPVIGQQRSVNKYDKIEGNETVLSDNRKNDSHSSSDREDDVRQENGAVFSEAWNISKEDVSKTSEAETQRNKFENTAFFELKWQLDCVSILMRQASKAMDACKKYRKFNSSIEIIEAERALLITGFRHDLLRQEIEKAIFEEYSSPVYTHTARVTISDLFLPINITDLERYFYSFVCIISCRGKVLATRAKEANNYENFIRFDGQFCFDNVPPDFDVDFDIYGLRVKKRKCTDVLCRGCFTSPRRRSNSTKRKLFYRDVQTCTLKEDLVPNSSFVRMGSLKADMSKVRQNRVWQLDMSDNSIIRNRIKFSSSIDNVSINIEKSGFLNIGTKINGCISWNRRWCILRGYMLTFLKHPNRRYLIESSGTTLDLKYSTQGKVYVSRNECPRRRTLLLEIGKKSTDIGIQFETYITKEVYFLNAETTKDMKEWQNVINTTLRALKQWHKLTLINI